MSNELSLQATGCFTSGSTFDLAQRIGTAIMKANIIPASYQNNLPNTIIALEMASRMGMSPILVMQNLHVIHGRPGWSSKFLIARVNEGGKYEDDLDFEFTGTEGSDDWSCRASATEKKSGKLKKGAKVSIAMAKAEGWHGKAGSKWKTMPEMMLMYRAASFFVSIHCPEAALGMATAEEVSDTIDIEHTDVTNLVAEEIRNNANKETFSFTPAVPVEEAVIDPDPEPEKPEEKPVSAGITPNTLFDKEEEKINADPSSEPDPF